MQKFTLTLLVITALSFQSMAQQVKLKESIDYPLSATAATDTLRIPLMVEKIPFGKVKFGRKPTFVRFSNRFEKSFADAITILKDDSGRASLLVAVDLLKLNKGGNYTASIPVTVNGKPQADLSITFIRPFATLDTIGKLQVLIEGCNIKPGLFRLTEKGRTSNINDLKIGPALFKDIAEKDAFTFKDPSVLIQAGTNFAVSYTPNETRLKQLDYGVSSGTIELNAPELEKPVTVQVEIIKSLSKLWIIYATFAGILIGSFVRIYLANKRELEGVRLKGYELADRIQRSTAHIQDKPFQLEINKILSALATSLAQKNFSLKPADKKTTMEDAIKIAGEEYNKKREVFDTALKLSTTRLQVLSQVFVMPDMPSVISNGLLTARQSFDKADKSLAIFNHTDADTEIENTITNIKNFLTNYTNRVSALIDKLNNDEFQIKAIPAEMLAMIRRNAEALKARHAAIKTDSEEPADALKAVEDAVLLQVNLKNTLQYMIDSMLSFFNSKYKADDTEPMKNFKEAFGNWMKLMEQIKDNPYLIIDQNIIDSLVKTIAELPATAKVRTTRGGGFSAAGENDAPFTIYNLGWIEKSSIILPFFQNNSNAGMNPLPEIIRRSASRILVINLVQLLILSLVLSLILYKTYSPAFIGKIDELITLFLLGFSINITVESILQLGSKKES